MRVEDYVPNRIAELCDKREISKYRLAQLTGLSQTAISKILSGKSLPGLTTLERICDAFQISLAQFFGKDINDLTKSQKKIMETWEILDPHDKILLDEIVESMKKISENERK